VRKNIDTTDFVKNIHSLRVGKSSGLDQVDYFVLNYDTLIENALSLEKIPYTDGFDGGAVGWWDNRTYERRELSARVFKIHGSIDGWNLSHP
jgi:SIR2-like protein